MMSAAAILAAASIALAAEEPAPERARAPGALPVKEVTVFKDGHAFVLEEGEAPVDASGAVVLDRLPAPVLGTFWAWSAEPGPKLRAVVAGKKDRPVDRRALDIRDLLLANIGAEGLFTEQGGIRYGGTIVAVPEARDETPEVSRPPEAAPAAPRRGSIALIRTDGGTKAVPLDRIQDVTFLGPWKESLREDASRPALTLRLDWGDGKPASTARVGMGYVQKGLRWIPGYRIELDGKGGATARLQATIVDEMVDLDDATVHLVVGVPSIAFKDTLDPVSLQKALAPLSSYFQTDSRTAYAFSNSIMSQSRAGEVRRQNAEAPAEPAEGAELGATGGARTEDLFVFTVPHITLRKGERAVIPVAEIALRYRDVYTVDIPFGPPPEGRGRPANDQEREVARLFRAPKAVHAIRLENRSRLPITTAPALVLEGGRLLCQSLATYTPPGGSSDLTLTKAVNLSVQKGDVETGRIPKAESWNGTDFARIDLAGKITLASHLDEPADVEVRRRLFGRADGADAGGSIEAIDALEEGSESEELPSWWSGYPWGWRRLNGIGKVEWKVRLEPGKSIELGYRWHYFAP